MLNSTTAYGNSYHEQSFVRIMVILQVLLQPLLSKRVCLAYIRYDCRLCANWEPVHVPMTSLYYRSLLMER